MLSKLDENSKKYEDLKIMSSNIQFQAAFVTNHLKSYILSKDKDRCL